MWGGSVIAAAIALAAPAPVAAAQAAQGPEPSVMIVEFPRGAPMIGFPHFCPGSSPDEDQSEIICLAELYQGRIRTVRHMSGPPVARGTRLRLTAHARPLARGTRMIVATYPFRDGEVSGQFAFWWALPEENGDFCVAAQTLDEWPDSPVRRTFERASYRRHFRADGYVEAADFRCVSGLRR